MGNSISKKRDAEKEDCISKIVNYNCPRLDIGTRRGICDYIDFIKLDEIRENVNVVKGRDIGSRFFIAVKCEFVYPDGSTDKAFSVFFQRYSDCKKLWHCCGCDEVALMNSEGGMNIEQFGFLCKLLEDGEVAIDRNTSYNTYLRCFHNGLPDYLHESMYPIALKLGHSDKQSDKHSDKHSDKDSDKEKGEYKKISQNTRQLYNAYFQK
jgi:hypothetical protein